jgi:hypothetical protein
VIVLLAGFIEPEEAKREKNKLRHRLRYLKIRKTHIARMAAYQKEHPEMSRASTKKWREKNRDRYNKYNRERRRALEP